MPGVTRSVYRLTVFCVYLWFFFVFITAGVSAGYSSLVIPATVVADVLQFM